MPRRYREEAPVSSRVCSLFPKIFSFRNPPSGIRNSPALLFFLKKHAKPGGRVNEPKKIVVVGAGLGGLAAAICLAKAGHQVEVWEKNASAGGKLQELALEGYRWDTGPSLMTMPHVLRDLFARAGARLEDHVELDRLDCTCRYVWPDGTVIDEDEAFWSQPEVRRFLDYARGIYELSGEAYLHHPPAEFWRAFTWKNLPKLRHLAKVATFQTLARKVEKFFPDPHRRQLFQRFATYNGSSPFLTPATFNIIPYVEAHFGGWYVKGGMVRVAQALGNLAESLGVIFRFQTEAISWREGTLSARDGRTERPDYLICNGDAIQSGMTWLKDAVPGALRKRLPESDASCSGYILFLGIKHRHERLRHHNIFFSEDYRKEFEDIFEKKRLPEDPTVYVAVTARSDPGHAPEGRDNYFVLVNAPAVESGGLAKETYAAYRDVVVRKLERCGLKGLSGQIEVERMFTPDDFAMRDLAWKGSLYGWASHSIRASLLRPPLRSRRDRRVFFAGGTTHPGGGIPLVLLSGKMAAEQILREAGI
jgi:phytoene desaturase